MYDFRESGRKGGQRAWRNRCAGRPYPPAAILRQWDYSLSPAQERTLARELARVMRAEGYGDADYGTAFNLTKRAALYPHLRRALDLALEQRGAVAA